MPKTAKRPNRAYKIAYWSEVQSIYYACTMKTFVHDWAFVIVAILIPSALTVLQFLSALNRSKKIGYVGFEVSYELLAPVIAEATERACSKRTLERGLHFLRTVGLVKLGWATTPDQEITNGPHIHLIRGTRQLRTVTLTPRALAMWDSRSSRSGSGILLHFAHLLTPAKMAGSSKIDQVVKPTMIKSHFPKSNTSTVSFDIDKTKTKAEGRPTSPQAVVEHKASTPTHPPTSPNLDSSPHAASIAPESNQTTELDTTPAGQEKGKKQTACHTQPSRRGCSHTPPPLPIHAKHKTSWPVGRAFLLVELHRSLVQFTEREADSIYAQFLTEISPSYPKNLPTTADWRYWARRFPLFSPEQRRGHMIRDILPLLRSEYVTTPNEPRRFNNRNTISSHICDGLDPFLQKLQKKFLK